MVLKGKGEGMREREGGIRGRGGEEKQGVGWERKRSNTTIKIVNHAKSLDPLCALAL